MMRQTFNHLGLSIVFLLSGSHSFVNAQALPKSASLVNSPIAFEASSQNSANLNLRNFQGKVVMIFHWSTSCSVCLDKMMELRDNAHGWSNRPFVLIAVNHNEKKQDYQDYVRILAALKSAPEQMQFIYYKDVLRDSLFKSTISLPQTFLIDAQGNLKNTYVGRIPPQAWDQVAELLP
jgi:peroxiredoxin